MINEQKITEILQEFSFPRLSGTQWEKKAFNLALKKIKDLDLTPEVQEFKFTTFFSRVYPKILFFLGFLLIVFLFFFIQIPGIVISSIILIILIIILIFIMRKPEKVKFYKYLDSANLYVKLSSRNSSVNNEDSRIKNLFFFCHLDSKGQKFSISDRVRATRTWVFTLLISVGIIIVRGLFSNYFLVIYLVIGSIPIIFNGVSMIILLLNTTNNSSFGAVDNASGIACVYELLKYFKNENSRLNSFTTWFVFTGSEECGTMGIRNFYKVMEAFDKDSIIIINFDAIGKNVTIFDSWYKPEGYLDFYKSFINNKEGLRIFENPKKIILGTHSDGYFLKKKFYQGIEFGDLGSYNFMHSSDDNLEKVDPKLLRSLCEVIIRNVKELDELNAKKVK